MDERRIDLLLVLGILVLAGPLVQVWNAQTASRYALTVAVVDDHSLELDPYIGVLGSDRAQFDGHTYSDKAPYQPMWAAPAYRAFRGLGGEPFPVIEGGQFVNRSTHWGLWWVTVWSATIPAMVLVVALRRLLRRAESPHAAPVAVALALGTAIFPFSSWLFGHVMAAALVAVAWSVLRPEARSPRGVLLGGLALGAGIGTEYTVALLAAIVLIDALARRRWIDVACLSAGTALATLPLLFYNWLTFHNPLEVSYQGHLPNFHGSGAFGVFNLTSPRPVELWRALLGDRGFFVLTPITIFAIVGCVLAIQLGGSLRRDGVVALVALAGFLVISTGIDGLGGDAPAPRYLIPMLPLLAVPLSVAWQRFARLCAGAAIAGTLTMWMATVTSPDLTSTESNALGTWLRELLAGDLVPNVLTGRDHRWVILVTSALGWGIMATALWRARDHELEST